MIPTTLKVQCKVHFKPARRGRKQLTVGNAPVSATLVLGRIPRVARLMALAIRFEGLIERREIRDYAELARLGHVTRARVTQIMNLLQLAPDIQEELLFLSPTVAGRDPIRETLLRPISAQAEWDTQRRRWKYLKMEQESGN